MEFQINFANPIECYDNTINNCVGRFCHVETSFCIDIGVLRVYIDTNIADVYSPEICQNILNNTKTMEGNVTVAFYILFGGVFSMRFLEEDTDDSFMKLPSAPVYETVTFDVNEKQFESMVIWNIQQLGRNYDIPRALLSVTPFSYKTDGTPSQYFCSQAVMYMLKHIYPFHLIHKDIDHMKPDAVYEWVWSLDIKNSRINITTEEENEL